MTAERARHGHDCGRMGNAGGDASPTVGRVARDDAGQPTPQFRLLGPLRVTLDGRELDLGGPQQRALLALLALSAGSAGAAGRADRRALGRRTSAGGHEHRPGLRLPAAAAAHGAGYRRIPTTHRQRPLPARRGPRRGGRPGVRAPVRGGPARSGRRRSASAARRLREALALWQGPPLLDLAGTATGDAVIARLESLRVAALADRVDADAALGRHAALVPELTDLVRRHPFDERFAGQLMLALYRDGRQAEALATYARACAPARRGAGRGSRPRTAGSAASGAGPGSGPAGRTGARAGAQPAPEPTPVLVSEPASVRHMPWPQTRLRGTR